MAQRAHLRIYQNGGLVRIGLATAERRTVRAGRRRIEVTWMEVTAAGRRAVAE
jgi:single-stranded DNA-binding protein